MAYCDSLGKETQVIHTDDLASQHTKEQDQP
jgi:hypothetical protein